LFTPDPMKEYELGVPVEPAVIRLHAPFIILEANPPIILLEEPSPIMLPAVDFWGFDGR